MEQEPLSEKREITDRELIDTLRVRGVEDPEARRLLAQWTEQEEKKVGSSPEASIEFNRKRARLYFAAGYKEAARDSLKAARTQAWNEGRSDLCNEIAAEMMTMETP